MKLGQAINAVTGTRRLCFWSFLQRMLLITQPPVRRIESSVKATLQQLFFKTGVRTRPKCEAIERYNTLYTVKRSNSALRFL